MRDLRPVRLGRAVAAVSGLALALLPAVAHAGNMASVALAQSKTDDARNVSAWSAERLRAARPLPIPEVSFDDTLAALPDEALALPEEMQGGESGSAPGRRPLPGIRPVHQRLFDPAERDLSAVREDLGSVAGPASGSVKAHFTSSRLIPEEADLEYPYSAVGVLFFRIPSQGDFFCSAAVIQGRLIATAAQCVHSGTSNPGFYTDFLFVPAYRDGDAPYLTWDWEYVVAPTAWTTGGGKVPNAADYALIELDDQVYFGVMRKIGQVTGSLGWATKRLHPNHAHLLSYTTSHDGADQMHQVAAQSFRNAASNNAEYGSDMRSGSQGGPLIQDFSHSPASMRWIGALSYYSAAAAAKFQGASIPDDRFTTLRTTACNHRPGNCT
jgi:V8-like Glu-specific endopeptidase